MKTTTLGKLDVSRISLGAMGCLRKSPDLPQSCVSTHELNRS